MVLSITEQSCKFYTNNIPFLWNALSFTKQKSHENSFGKLTNYWNTSRWHLRANKLYIIMIMLYIIYIHSKISNIIRIKFQNINFSRLALQLSSRNILKPCVKSTIEDVVGAAKRSAAPTTSEWKQFYYLLRCDLYYWSFDGLHLRWLIHCSFQVTLIFLHLWLYEAKDLHVHC